VLAASLARAAASGDHQQFVDIDVAAWQWLVFLGLVAALLIFDLAVLHREPRTLTLREAASESAVWIAIGLGFSFVIWWWFGGPATNEYVSAYLIEESLSVDNVFVWAVIMAFFLVPPEFQFRTLFWGILGALVLRAAFIFAGVALVQRFDPILYVFGAFLLYTAWRIARHDEAHVDPERNVPLRVVRRVVPSTAEYDGQRLFTRVDGRRLATPLFAVLVMIATTDVVFAVDSIPAVLGVARDPFIVLSSNLFAVLGLRALYFCLQGMSDRFRYLNVGIGVILGFVGLEMLFRKAIELPHWASLLVIASVLAVTVGASVVADRRSRVED
jgi:tellurite resistance protein TerC